LDDRLGHHLVRASLDNSVSLNLIMSFQLPVCSLALILTFQSLANASVADSAAVGTPSNIPAVPSLPLPSATAAPAITPVVTPSTLVTAPVVTPSGPTIPPNPTASASGTAPAVTEAPRAQELPPAMQKPPQSASQNGERSSYSSVHVEGPYIAMTFDDGPSAALTPRLLDILKERHIHVTFFVLGQMVKAHPEILAREVAEGHQIGNHTWDHLPLTKVVSREGGLTHEIADTSALIKQVTGKAPVILRPPYGATNPRLSRAIEKEYGMKVILWSVDPDDWKDPGPQVVKERILSGWKESAGAKPGAIILSHDIHKGTVESMPATLDALLAKGYKFVTVSELLALERKAPASPAPTAVHNSETNADPTNSKSPKVNP